MFQVLQTHVLFHGILTETDKKKLTFKIIKPPLIFL